MRYCFLLGLILSTIVPAAQAQQTNNLWGNYASTVQPQAGPYGTAELPPPETVPIPPFAPMPSPSDLPSTGSALTPPPPPASSYSVTPGPFTPAVEADHSPPGTIACTSPIANGSGSGSAIANGSGEECPKPHSYHWYQLWYEEHCAAARTMPQHHLYPANETYYYFRPYRYGEVIQQLGTAQRWNANTYNVYDNRFLQAIYQNIPEVVPADQR